jgi:hypothetical protein
MASTAAAGSWLQVDLGRPFYISGVSTQGRFGASHARNPARPIILTLSPVSVSSLLSPCFIRCWSVGDCVHTAGISRLQYLEHGVQHHRQLHVQCQH